MLWINCETLLWEKLSGREWNWGRKKQKRDGNFPLIERIHLKFPNSVALAACVTLSIHSECNIIVYSATQKKERREKLQSDVYHAIGFDEQHCWKFGKLWSNIQQHRQWRKMRFCRSCTVHAHNPGTNVLLRVWMKLVIAFGYFRCCSVDAANNGKRKKKSKRTSSLWRENDVKQHENHENVQNW